MWESFPKLSKIDEFELFTTNIVRSEFFFLLVMNTEYDVRSNKLSFFRNERKPMLGLFLKSWKPMKLNCFCNEQKSMLGLFLKS
jgi:hypothetical protein